MRNGQRWQVIGVDSEHQRIAARRIGDGARAVFEADYLGEHVQLGHAVTVHSAQGVTAERVHAVIADTATRNLAYVAMTRGRESNHVYLYQRTVGEADHQHRSPAEGVHVAQRGSPAQAAALMRTVIGRDERARTAHQTAADTPVELLPERVASGERASADRHRPVGHPPPHQTPNPGPGHRPPPRPSPHPRPRSGSGLRPQHVARAARAGAAKVASSRVVYESDLISGTGVS